MRTENQKSILNDVNKLIEKSEKYDELVKAMGNYSNIKTKTERFYAKSMTVELVAQLHDQSTQTVRKYIELGLIPLHPLSTNKRLLILESLTVTSSVHRMIGAKESTPTALYGSIDCEKFHLVATSTDKFIRSTHGSPYNYFVFAIGTDFKNGDSLSGTFLTYDIKRNNKLR